MPVADGGLAAGKTVLLGGSVENRIRWWSNHSIARIGYRGPITINPVGPRALTLCGGPLTPSCAQLEEATCFRNGLSDSCGMIEIVRFEVDADDTPVTAAFYNISGFADYARSSPQLFYLSLETGGGVEIIRGDLSGLCRRDDL